MTTPGHTSYHRPELNTLADRYSISNDRVYDDMLELPHTSTDLHIQSNTLITSDVINKISSKLYENYMYMLSRCKVAKTDAFTSYRGFFEFTDSVYTTTLTGDYSTDQPTSDFDNIMPRDVRSINLVNTSTPGVYGLIIASKNSIQMYDFIPVYQPQQNGIILSVSKGKGEKLVESNNELEFENISKVITGKSDSMYVYDSGRSVIYKYLITGLTRKDRVILQQQTKARQLIEIFGGTGAASAPTQFNNVIDIAYHQAEDQLYVLDVDDSKSYIKIYDNQLNWVDSINISLDLRDDIPIAIKVHENIVYILTTTGKLYKYTISSLQTGVLDAETVINLGIIDFDFVLDEQYVDIVFSATSANLCYVLTNKTIYKRYISRLNRTVASISWQKHNILNGQVHPKFLSLFPRGDEQQDIMLIAATGDDQQSRLLHFTEDENVQELLSRNYESQVYLLSSVEVKSNETVSSFVYNKWAYKYLYNNQVILNNIKYVSTVEIDYDANFIYPGIRYISQQEVNSVLNSRNKNVLVGVNELVTSGVLNRLIDDIVTDQKLVLDVVVDRKNSKQFYNNTLLVLKKTPVPHMLYKIIKPPVSKIPPEVGGTHKIIKI